MNPSNLSTQEEIEKWLQPIIEKEKFENYTVTVSGSSEKGDGYLGDITFVEVQSSLKTLNFVIKSGKKSTQLRELMPIRSAFENEVYFYKEVLPTFLEFQKEKKILEPFDNAPKCYDTQIFNNMEVLILENMKTKGYYLWDRTKPMDPEHIRAVVKTYGKLHAISFALKDQKPELFKRLSSSLVDIFKLITETVKEPEDNVIFNDIIDIAKSKQESQIVEKVLELKGGTRILNDMTDPSDPYAVILHGDCWNNNFMFKSENDGRPPVPCLLDFQICRLASPAYDLSYFLFTCISEDDLKNFDEIIDVYYESFSSFLEQLGSDPVRMFPFEEVWNQFKRFSKFGLTLLPSIIRICLSQKDEVSDLTEAVEAGREIADAFSYTVKNIEEYERRTLPVIKFAIDKQFI